MIRWVAVIFIGLTIFLFLFPELGKLGIGRLPGDFRVSIGRYTLCIPFGSTLVISLIAFGIAELA